MCGVGKVLKKVLGPAAEIATSIFAPEFLPVVATGVGLAEGKGIGQSLLGGAEALAGQELAGAVGIGTGNSAFNDALGITTTPGSTGLPDIGGFLQNEASSALGGVEDTLGIGGAAAGDTGTGSGLNGEFQSAAGGSGTAAGSAAPASATTAGGSILSSLNAPAAADAAIGDELAPGTLSGTATSATPGLSSVAGDTVAPTAASGAVASDIARGIGFQDTLGGGAAASAASGLAAPASAPAASGGLLGKAGSLAKYALPVGNLAYQAISGPGALPSASKELQSGGAVTAPELATEQSRLAEANSGTLSAPEQQTITNYVQQQENLLIQQLAQQGVTNVRGDSRYIAGMDNIRQQAMALQQQYLQQALTEGLAAGGAASGNLSTVSQQQLTQDANFQNSLGAAMKALGMTAGGTTINIGGAGG